MLNQCIRKSSKQGRPRQDRIAMKTRWRATILTARPHAFASLTTSFSTCLEGSRFSFIALFGSVYFPQCGQEPCWFEAGRSSFALVTCKFRERHWSKSKTFSLPIPLSYPQPSILGPAGLVKNFKRQSLFLKRMGSDCFHLLAKENKRGRNPAARIPNTEQKIPEKALRSSKAFKSLVGEGLEGLLN